MFEELIRLGSAYGRPDLSSIFSQGRYRRVFSIEVDKVGLSIIAEGTGETEEAALLDCYRRALRINRQSGLFCIKTAVHAPCATCGDLTPMTNTKRCNGCWETEARLPEYLASAKGRQFVAAQLAKALKEEPS